MPLIPNKPLHQPWLKKWWTIQTRPDGLKLTPTSGKSLTKGALKAGISKKQYLRRALETYDPDFDPECQDDPPYDVEEYEKKQQAWREDLQQLIEEHDAEETAAAEVSSATVKPQEESVNSPSPFGNTRVCRLGSNGRPQPSRFGNGNFQR